MSRKPLIAGNWKMNKNHLEAVDLVQKISFALPKEVYSKVDATVIPPFTDIRSVQTLVDSDKLQLKYGAQDLSTHDAGAYTGEISGEFLAKLGCTYVVVGHSERRQYHHETDELVATKAAKALSFSLKPIVCVGESEAVREANDHIAFNKQQVAASLAGLSAEDMQNVVIAYEPVWAIGTGKVASAADAEEVCGAIREELAAIFNDNVAENTIIQYGGSVTSDSIAELIGKPNVDGALVGGASLKPEEFAKIIVATADNS